jgi:polysaccharide biosynthesis transport protein
MNRILTIAHRHRKALIYWNTALIVMAGVFLIREKPDWTAKGALILSANNRTLNANLGKLGSVTDGETYFSQQVDPLTVLTTIVTSDETMAQIFAIDPDPDRKKFKTLLDYKKCFIIKPQPTSTIMAVTVTGKTSEITQKRADNLFNVFQQRLDQLRQQDAAQRSNFMQKELEQSRKNLHDAQQALAQYKQATGLINTDEQTKQLVVTISTLTAAESDALSRAKANQAQLSILTQRLKISPDQAVRSIRLNESQPYQVSQKALIDAQLALSQAEAQYKPDTPEIKLLKDSRDHLQAQVNQTITDAAANAPGTQTSMGNNLGDLMKQVVLTEGNAQSAEQQAQQIQTQIQDLRQQLNQFPSAQARLQELQRQYDISEGVHNGLVAKVQETKVNSFSNYPSVQVLDNPKVEDKASGSKKLPIIMGTILAAIFGTIALMLFRESRNPLISPKDVQKTEIPVIGTLPILEPTWTDLQRNSSLEFQRLASAISLVHLHQNRLMITSATPLEGRSTVTLGLATALTTLGFQVLIVDGDFRRGRLRQRLSIPALSEIQGTPYPIAPGLDLLSFTVPPTRILEFVAQGEFARVLDQAQATHTYDYVLIDSAPICTTGESALMGSTIQDLLWVMRPGVSERFAIRKAIAQLARHSVRSIGIVINGHIAEGDRPAKKTVSRPNGKPPVTPKAEST